MFKHTFPINDSVPAPLTTENHFHFNNYLLQYKVNYNHQDCTSYTFIILHISILRAPDIFFGLRSISLIEMGDEV